MPRATEPITETGRPEARGHGAAIFTLVLLFLLPIVYVLSIGPAALLTKQGYLGNSTRHFYFPVIWLHDNTLLREPLEKYVDWWDG